MTIILSIAIAISLATSAVILLRFPMLELRGPNASPLLVFMAILFTSGLDVGLIMFPLTEFPVYESEEAYGFTNALAIEFGFWGGMVWAFYFLTTFYFCVVEPRLRLFEIPWISAINSGVVVSTCAFTGYLFLTFLPSYIPGIPDAYRYALVAFVVLMAVISSTDIRYIKWLGLGSTFLFFILIALLWWSSNTGLSGLFRSAASLGGYFENLPDFLSPLSDYHAFYLFWWFAWSIMIGQFVARFVGGMPVWQLCLALLTLPSIPIALWFSVLYIYHTEGIELSVALRGCMVTVGVIFVVNSLDSLTRLYSDNLNLTVTRFGRGQYIIVHWTLLVTLILLYQFTPLKIEWIGLVVVGLYAVVYFLTFVKRTKLVASS
ncbi:BCCT family transporter [Congregibacter sp.]|uniref:BCCT family transporter n=1 Tax=Congregibacter sp. TaxID=2744308 RepID=UPI00385A1110